MSTPRPDHPWYGRNNHVKHKRSASDILIDREIERAILLERLSADKLDMEGYLRASHDPSYMVIDGGLRRVPVRYDSTE